MSKKTKVKKLEDEVAKDISDELKDSKIGKLSDGKIPDQKGKDEGMPFKPIVEKTELQVQVEAGLDGKDKSRVPSSVEAVQLAEQRKLNPIELPTVKVDDMRAVPKPVSSREGKDFPTESLSQGPSTQLGKLISGVDPLEVPVPSVALSVERGKVVGTVPIKPDELKIGPKEYASYSVPTMTFRNFFQTNWSIFVLSTLYEPTSILEWLGFKIGVFSSPVEFSNAMLDLASKIVEKYSYVLRGIETVDEERFRGRMGKPSQIGFDLETESKKVTLSTERSSLLALLEHITTEPTPGAHTTHTKSYTVIVPEAEFKIQAELEAIQKTLLLPSGTYRTAVERLHAYYRYFDTADTRISPIAESHPYFDSRYENWFVSLPQFSDIASDVFLSNVPLRDVALSMTSSLMNSLSSIFIKEGSIMMTTLAGYLGLSSTSASVASSALREIDSKEGGELADAIKLVMAQGQICHLQVDVSVEDTDTTLHAILGYLLAMMVLPGWLFDQTSLNRMANYLFVHFFSKTTAFRGGAAMLPNRGQQQMASVNYLVQALNGGGFTAAFTRACGPFIRTFGDNNVLGFMPYTDIPDHDIFVNVEGRGPHHVLAPFFYGSQVPVDGDFTLPKFAATHDFISWLSANKNFNLPGGKKMMDSLLTMLNVVSASSIHQTDMAYYLDYDVQRASSIGFCFPKRAQDPRTTDSYVSKAITIDPYAVIALIRLIDWGERKERSISIAERNAFHASNYAIHELVAMRDLVFSVMPKKRYSKSKRWEKVLSMWQNDAGLKPLFSSTYIGSPMIDTLILPGEDADLDSASFFIGRYASAFEYMASMKTFLGYADSFYYVPASGVIVDTDIKEWSAVWRMDTTLPIGRSVTYENLTDMLDRDDDSYNSLFRDADEGNYRIHFRIQIKTSLSKVEIQPSQSDVFEFDDSKRRLKIGALETYVRSKDLDYTSKAPKVVHGYRPRYFVSDWKNYKTDVVAEVSSWVRPRVALRSSYVPFDGFKVKVVERSA